MKKIFSFLVIVFSIILSTSCDRVRFYLSEIVLTDYDTPYISTLVNDEPYISTKVYDEQVENTFIKDAKVSIYEITEEEYNKRNGENAFIEILSNTDIKGRYIGLDLQVLIDEEKGYQEVTIYDIKSDPYFSYYCKYKIDVNFETLIFEGEFFCQYFDHRVKSLYENCQFTIQKLENVNEKQKYILDFYKSKLMTEDVAFCKTTYSNAKLKDIYFDIKIITKEEYEKRQGQNVLKQETWGEFEDVDLYIELVVKSKLPENTFLEITNLKMVIKQNNTCVGDVKLIRGKEVLYSRLFHQMSMLCIFRCQRCI